MKFVLSNVIIKITDPLQGTAAQWNNEQPPEGWAFAEGQTVGRFELPDLRGRVILAKQDWDYLGR